ncbi:MAG: DUF1343 domain-containing protein [Nitrospirae bacterium]|nr:DUF1343 domain-containing protein [Nitrospirota bacterium]
MKALFFCLTVFCLLYGHVAAAAVPGQSAINPTLKLESSKLISIADSVEKAIRDNKTPGAVLLIGNQGEVVYRRSFGYRSLEPEKIRMTEETIFDLASLTKAIATTTAVMQLAEQKKLNIEAPVARYWPAFKKNGKGSITVRQLLTHYSGLRPDLSLQPKWSGYKKAMAKIIAERPEIPPNSGFIYSDINFEVLGELVRRITGQPLDRYCAEHIFKPLGMKDTAFKPSPSLLDRIAPTHFAPQKQRCGVVHDPSCFNMGGVAGHAGLFSTADDLAVFARMLLNKGTHRGRKILSAKTVELMTTPQSPQGMKRVRGLGWDLEAPFFSNREALLPLGAYGHLGYTGTSLWIDPVTETYIIVLTNRVYPDGRGDIKELRAEIKKAVADAFGPATCSEVLEKRPGLGGRYHCLKTETPNERISRKVMTGIDVLSAENFLPLKGLRVGLITNHTGLDAKGQRTIDLLRSAPGLKLTALFSPEHGLTGTVDQRVNSTTDPGTGLPVYSLYGSVRRPTEEMLKDLDALVFDIQDAGVRFYTYISTMGYAMEAAAKKGIDFYVLDRPNPLNASVVEGPVLDRDLLSFTGYFPLPLRHGMTVGELAEMFNAENMIGAKLHVIKLSGYDRNAWFDETVLRWVNPSPNLRSLTEAILYPGVAIVEGSNLSVGRGTDTPFEILGAPWINAERLAEYLNSKNIPGVSFRPVRFTPNSDAYKNKTCQGVRITLTDRQTLNVADMGIEIVSALHKLYPADFQLDKILGMIGSKRVLQDFKDGLDPGSIALQWQSSLSQFLALRSKYLLY